MHQDGHPLMPSRDRLPSDLTTAGPSYPLRRGRPLSFVVAVCLAAPRTSRGGVSSRGGRGGDVLDAPGTWKVTPGRCGRRVRDDVLVTWTVPGAKEDIARWRVEPREPWWRCPRRAWHLEG